MYILSRKVFVIVVIKHSNSISSVLLEVEVTSEVNISIIYYVYSACMSEDVTRSH